MTLSTKLMWAGVAVVLVLLIAAVSIPNLLRSRIAANEAALVGKLRNGDKRSPEAAGQTGPLGVGNQPVSQDRKLIRDADLGLVVHDVNVAAEQIRRLTESSHGIIETLEIKQSSGMSSSATINVRLPASGLDSALPEFKKVAIRTEREQVTTRDVTREFFDNEAHLRNLHAEEQQYLAIMKQAHTVKDTLDVAAKLSDVRDRIERLQAQIQVMTRDTEMSEIRIVMMEDPDLLTAAHQWHPLQNATSAARELRDGLGDWVDWAVATLLKLPLYLLWIVTGIGIPLLIWRLGRFLWLRWLKPKEDSDSE